MHSFCNQKRAEVDKLKDVEKDNQEFFHVAKQLRKETQDIVAAFQVSVKGSGG